MFYSQFILAKKGPLGTIWIAAHLERKLRKNQVADTDIGESVDSILFPDVPIALRLSSHLLVGVVRIYSRKVSYLFHDCSEALLKIKQAFRSTAVDLPPEESTAPYHSITLPETFDLDDFELPDSALLSGNFVDHHVSTREQITLQDTVDATGYSTSQFGLHERFGDGDASQIRLDLDEDVVLDKGSAAHHISNLLGSGGVEGQIPGEPETPFPDMDIDGCQNDYEEEQNAETSKDIPERVADDLGRPVLQNVQDLREEDPSADGYNVQTPCLHKEVSHGEHVRSPHAVPDDVTVNQMLLDSTENAQAPSTPGLMQEAIPANVQENPALSPSGKASPSNDAEVIVVNAAQSSHIESDSHVPNDNDILNTTCKMLSPSSILEQPEVVTLASQPLVLPSTASDRSNPPCGDSAGAADSCQDNATLTSNYVSSLRPCNTKMNQDNITSPLDGTNDLLSKLSDVADGKEELHAGGSSAVLQDVNWKSGQVHTPEEADLSKDVSPNEILKDARLEVNYSASNEYPEPERMLFAAARGTDVVNDLGQCTIEFGQCTTAEKGVTEFDVSVDKLKSTQGRKRRLTESTPVLLNDNSAKLSRASLLGRNPDYIPHDDDVLASILVGRSPALKMKPTPTVSAMPSSKRTRLSGRSGVPKRKVLMDDTMVLHADAIRQQLINTEDIRRTRRKAPCTNPEIWMMQKCSLEEEIFSEPVLTGVTVELVVLHSQAYDPNEIPDSNCPYVEVPNVQNLGSSGFIEEARVNELAIVTGNNDGERQEFTDVLRSAETMNRSFKCDADDQRESLRNACQPEVSSCDHQGPVIHTEPDTGTVVNIEAQEPLLSAPYSEGICHLPVDAITEMISIDKQDGSGEENSELPLHEDQQTLLESSQFCKEFGEMNAKVEVSRDDMLNYTEEGSTAGDTSLSYPKNSDLDACKAVNDDVPVSVVDHCSTEVEVAFRSNASVLEADVSTSVQDMDIPACEQINIQTNEQSREINMDSSIDGQVVAEDDNGKATSEHMLVNVAEEVAMSDSQPTSTRLEDNPATVGESVSIQDVMMGTSHLDSSAPGDSNVQDLFSAMDENDTDFLNVDDEADYDEEVDNDVPNTEEAQPIENSGWSTRTRGVARYLKSLFDDESGPRKTTVAMDHLLAGKTRKEASRMFFETLVLKTKDFIHVEQENSFRNIDIKPRSKLLKSEF